MREVKVKVYSYDELCEEAKETLREEYIESVVASHLDAIFSSFDKTSTDKEYQEKIGCSKYYAESTSHFVPAVYYEHHKDEVEAETLSWLRDQEYRETGEVFNID
jgi:hypothetical protein